MKNLNFMGPINQLGYGQVSTNIALNLSKKYNLSLSIIGSPEVSTQEEADIISRAVRNSTLLDFDAPCIKVWHQNDMSTFMGRGERIGFPIFELDNFSNIEEHHLGSLDKIFVASQWAKGVVIDQIDTSWIDVEVIPFGQKVDDKKPILNGSDTTRFFTCGKWEIRKGHDKLIEAFNKAFNDDDHVELHMMCTNPFLDEKKTLEWKKLYINSKLGSKVRFVPRVKTHQEVIEIMRKMDCGVFISRAEGWNLELLEMICCGKPVIATYYSGHTEFCNDNNAKLVYFDSLEPAYDGIWFDGKVGGWGKIGENQIDQIVEHMRFIHKNKYINDFGFSETRKKYTWENTAMEITKYV